MCGLTRFLMPACCAASLQTYQTVLSRWVVPVLAGGSRWEITTSWASSIASIRGTFRARRDRAAHRGLYPPCPCEADDHAFAIDVLHAQASSLRRMPVEYSVIRMVRASVCPQRRSDGQLPPGSAPSAVGAVPGVRQELAELVTLERLDEKEAQRRDLVDHRAGRQFALVSVDTLDRFEVRWDRACRETCRNTWRTRSPPAGICEW